ncbi:MAG: M15 family metallopeptidase [Pseudomonadales bacterium]|nr:M15 family metallopeptidase [Pseudomonadales bacterium]
MHELTPGFTHIEEFVNLESLSDDSVDSYLEKIRNFEADYRSDIFLDEAQQAILEPTLSRLDRVQSFVGHGNFNLLGFDEMLHFARNYPEIGAFTPAELNFLEAIFAADASTYGFFGSKVTSTMTATVPISTVVKIAGSGHYLFKGSSLARYEHLRKDVGEQLLLTSGVRNVVKQMHLFLAKTRLSSGNLSKASRSLAPPGYSFHGVGDFDVGKAGLGGRNFTADFSQTLEFKQMIKLGYVDLRYTDTNTEGVRFEPWHIKIA